jgi:WbqC-like protein
MRVVILQPSYLPWLGYFDQMCKSDVFVIYDDVQYDKNSWRNRNRIKTPQGWQWLTVPVLLKGRNFPLNRDVEINADLPWQSKHLKSIVQNYRQARFFTEFIGTLEGVLTREWKFLFELNIELLYRLKKQLGLETEIHMASELKIGRAGKTERLIEICRYFGADSFLEGDAGKNYIDESLFSNARIRLEYHQYQHPVYQQLHGDFIPYLSVVDLLFNHGSDSKPILTNRKTIT